jgi:hypothetical protein
MDADEIVPLTAEAVRRLLELQQAPVEVSEDLDKRAAARWPFPGAVEIWVPDEGGIERHVLGACHNLTDCGVGVRCDEPIETGATLSIAIHQPELSLHGQAMVRHCTMRGQGYLVGFEFVFQAG